MAKLEIDVPDVTVDTKIVEMTVVAGPVRVRVKEITNDVYAVYRSGGETLNAGLPYREAMKWATEHVEREAAYEAAADAAREALAQHRMTLELSNDG